MKIARQQNLQAQERKQCVEEHDAEKWIRFNHEGTHATCAFCTGAKHMNGMSQMRQSQWVKDGVNLAEMTAKDRAKAIHKHSTRPGHALALQHRKSQKTLWDANTFMRQRQLHDDADRTKMICAYNTIKQ